MALAALVAGAPYLAGGPVWDDHTLVVGQLAQLDWHGLAQLWTEPVGGGVAGSGYYRPLAMTVLSLLGRTGMTAVHLAATLLHALSAILVVRLLGDDRGAVAGGLVFAVHPLASEVLGWASALPDALSLALALGAVAAPAWPLAAACALGAMLSKEAALVVLLWGAASRQHSGSGRLALGVPVVLALLLRVVLGVGGPGLTVDWGEAISSVLAQVGRLAWPLPLSAVRDTACIRGGEIALGVGVLALVGAVAVRGRKDAAWAAVLLVGAPAVALPTVLQGHLAADRYLYGGLVGLAVLVAAVMREARGGERGLLVGGGLVVLLGVGVHVGRAPAWQSDEALFSSAVRVCPSSGFAHHFLGHARARAGRFEAAAQTFEAAVHTGRAHPVDRQLALQAWVLADRPTQALAWAGQGPQDGLTADWMAWLARAALDAGDRDRARRVLAPLARPDGSWDGPAFVAELAAELAQDAPD